MSEVPLYVGSSKNLKDLTDFDERKGPQSCSQNLARPLPRSSQSGVAQSAGGCTVRQRPLALHISGIKESRKKESQWFGECTVRHRKALHREALEVDQGVRIIQFTARKSLLTCVCSLAVSRLRVHAGHSDTWILSFPP